MNCYIFDIDGTMIDTGTIDCQSFQQTLGEFGYDYEIEDLTFALGIPGRKSLKQLNIPEEQIEPIMERWEKLSLDRLDEVEIYDGIVSVLEGLRAAGKKCGVVTSRTKAQLEKTFIPMGISHYFDEIVCVDDVKHPKPAPDGLLECIRRLNGTTEDTIYIGDSAYDMQSAAAAGVKSALALWGAHAPDGIQADMRLKHPSEIMEQ